MKTPLAILFLVFCAAGPWMACKPTEPPPPPNSQTARPAQPDPFRAANVRDNAPEPTLAFPPLDPAGSNSAPITP